MTTCETKLSMKLLIDTKAKKVIFAEAEKNCVDFLFHILSLPVATVINLLKEKGMNYGCLPKLYESVENLNDTYIQSKDILLKPKSSVTGISSVPLLSIDFSSVPLLSIDYVPVAKQKTFYGCYNYIFHDFVSDYPTAKCPNCQHPMSRKLTYVDPPVVCGAVGTTNGFVKDVVTYMVMDDLVVKPMSTISGIALLNKFNVKDVGVLQEEVVNFGIVEALMLLKASFESKTVLTTVFMSLIMKVSN